VRGYNNTVNKNMSSEMEENFISQNQFTVILAMVTSQCKGRADILYNLQLIQPSWGGMDTKNTNLLNGRRHRSAGVMKSASVT
jgi:hypothetical protein